MKKESDWFRGLKNAERDFKSYSAYLDGLFTLETKLYYIGFSQEPYYQGIRDYYNHVLDNPDVFNKEEIKDEV